MGDFLELEIGEIFKDFWKLSPLKFVKHPKHDPTIITPERSLETIHTFSFETSKKICENSHWDRENSLCCIWIYADITKEIRNFDCEIYGNAWFFSCLPFTSHTQTIDHA